MPKLPDILEMGWKAGLAIVALVLFVFVLFITPEHGLKSISGFMSVQDYAQTAGITAENSRSFFIESSKGSFSLKSFKISGEVIGDGAVQVFLKEGSKKLLVYTNMKVQKHGLNFVTGQVVKLLVEPEKAEYLRFVEGSPINEVPLVPDGFETSEELFSNSCSESCVLPVEFYNKEKYVLELLVTPGTVLKIDKIEYLI